jgi:hypothetical protein
MATIHFHASPWAGINWLGKVLCFEWNLPYLDNYGVGARGAWPHGFVHVDFVRAAPMYKANQNREMREKAVEVNFTVR